jgi:mono/diheme cytochrome c family protein
MLKRVVLWTLAGVTLAIGGGVLYLWLRKPAMAPPREIKVAMTPERIARGRYLFEQLSDCGGCHSPRDFSRFNGPEIEGQRASGTVFPDEFGLPGKVTAPNLTPDPETGLGRWTDGEKIRAIREGVARDGRPLFPMMPYRFYRSMSDPDVEALVAYMNQLPPVRRPLPTTKIDFPVNLFVKGAPQPVGSVPPPDRSSRVRYGEYLTRLAGCMDCHTPLERVRPAEDKLLSGGREFRLGGGLVVVSANITPDDSGIGPWSERQFLDKFAEYRDYVKNGPPPARPASFTLMPWIKFCQLPDEDLGAIFAFLKTQKPVRNNVETHPGAPKE